MLVLKLFALHALLSAYKILNAENLGIRHCTTPGLVALTFDDGPSLNGETENLLKVLKKENVKATFFVTGYVGYQLDQEPFHVNQRKQNLLRRIFNEGHQIGSHSWSHSRITNLTISEAQEDISRLATFVQDILGINMTVFRAPYGDSNTDIIKMVDDNFNYKLIYWSIDTNDWKHKNDLKASFSDYKNIIGPTVSAKRNSFIALHHDPQPKSGELAKMAIDFVKSKKFKLVTVGKCIGVKDYVYFK